MITRKHKRVTIIHLDLPCDARPVYRRHNHRVAIAFTWAGALLGGLAGWHAGALWAIPVALSGSCWLYAGIYIGRNHRL